MKKCPVLLVVSGFLTENDISWFNRIKAGCGLDVRYYKWESANLLSILSSDIANKWGLYTLSPREHLLYCHQSPSHLKRVRPGIMQRKQQLITEKN